MGADADLQQALRDPVREVQLAALSSIAESPRRTTLMQASLTAIVSNPLEATETRHAALDALRSVPLSREDATVLDTLEREMALRHR